jgi:NADP-dependent 3-hydroxy acid dehydrogenase YdfG
VTSSSDPTQRFRLDEQTVIVTGASSGLGAPFAGVVAGAGATVVVAARRRARRG